MYALLMPTEEYALTLPTAEAFHNNGIVEVDIDLSRISLANGKQEFLGGTFTDHTLMVEFLEDHTVNNNWILSGCTVWN